jgi:hypothetical protein
MRRGAALATRVSYEGKFKFESAIDKAEIKKQAESLYTIEWLHFGLVTTLVLEYVVLLNTYTTRKGTFRLLIGLGTSSLGRQTLWSSANIISEVIGLLMVVLFTPLMLLTLRNIRVALLLREGVHSPEYVNKMQPWFMRILCTQLTILAYVLIGNFKADFISKLRFPEMVHSCSRVNASYIANECSQAFELGPSGLFSAFECNDGGEESDVDPYSSVLAACRGQVVFAQLSEQGCCAFGASLAAPVVFMFFVYIHSIHEELTPRNWLGMAPPRLKAAIWTVLTLAALIPLNLVVLLSPGKGSLSKDFAARIVVERRHETVFWINIAGAAAGIIAALLCRLEFQAKTGFSNRSFSSDKEIIAPGGNIVSLRFYLKELAMQQLEKRQNFLDSQHMCSESKFVTTCEQFQVAEPGDAVGGLETLLRDPTVGSKLALTVASIEKEYEKSAQTSDDERECLDYILTKRAGTNKRGWPTDRLDHVDGGVPDSRLTNEGKRRLIHGLGAPAEQYGMQFRDFCEHPYTNKAGLSEAEVLALRLYTTAAYRGLNNPLRERRTHPFPNTVACIRSAISKMRVLQEEKQDGFKELDLWRGMSGLRCGQEFMGSSAGGHSHGGTELAPMSTTADFKIAVQYSIGEDSGQSLIMKIRTKDFVMRGADLSYLSAFPDEEEVLFPPLTYLRPTGFCTKVVHGHGGKVMSISSRLKKKKNHQWHIQRCMSLTLPPRPPRSSSIARATAIGPAPQDSPRARATVMSSR